MLSLVFFFFNDTATTEIYTLSLHDALPIWCWACTSRRISTPSCTRSRGSSTRSAGGGCATRRTARVQWRSGSGARSEEHTSELQSRQYLVCRLLLEKKKNTNIST